MADFEFIITAECGTHLQIGLIEASSLSDALSEIAGSREFDIDADAVQITIKEKSVDLDLIVDRGMHISGGQR